MRLNQVTIPSTDVPRSIAFYTKLGLKLIVHSNDDYARLLCEDGGSTFSIMRVDSLEFNEGVHVYFESDRLDEWVSDLKEAGMQFMHEPIDQRWLWREARVKDPDGHTVVLYHAGDNRVNPPWRLKD